jgi:hypothetical protein
VQGKQADLRYYCSIGLNRLRNIAKIFNAELTAGSRFELVTKEIGTNSINIRQNCIKINKGKAFS